MASYQAAIKAKEAIAELKRPVFGQLPNRYLIPTKKDLNENKEKIILQNKTSQFHKQQKLAAEHKGVARPLKNDNSMKSSSEATTAVQNKPKQNVTNKEQKIPKTKNLVANNNTMNSSSKATNVFRPTIIKKTTAVQNKPKQNVTTEEQKIPKTKNLLANNNSMNSRSKATNVFRPTIIKKTTAVQNKPKQNVTKKEQKIPKTKNLVANMVAIDASTKAGIVPASLPNPLEILKNKPELEKNVCKKIVASHSETTKISYGNIKKFRDKILVASEYAADFYNHLFERENKLPICENHLDKQLKIKPIMRSKLINWINEISFDFHLLIETFQISVAIVDRYMQLVNDIKLNELQLIGVTATFLAAKYEELFPPPLAYCVFVTDSTYTPEQIVVMERNIFSKINFNLPRLVPIQFLRKFSQEANINNRLYLMAKYLMELSSMSYELASVRPSKIAAASLFLAMHLYNANADSKMGFSNELWTTTLSFHSHYKAEELHTIGKHMAQLAINAPNSEFQAIYKKYQKCEKFDNIVAHPEFYGSLIKSIAEHKD